MWTVSLSPALLAGVKWIVANAIIKLLCTFSLPRGHRRVAKRSPHGPEI